MRLSSCLWGGSLSPIIPVCRTKPKPWSSHHERISGAQITQGYLRFDGDQFDVSAIRDERGSDPIEPDLHDLT